MQFPQNIPLPQGPSLNEKDVEMLKRQLSKSWSLQKQHDELQEELIQRIRNGHTTGDSIKDFLIVNHQPEDSDLGKRLVALQKEINDNQGQKVLVLTHHRTSREQTGCFGGGYVDIRLEALQLGVINGALGADVNKGEVFVPTSKYYGGAKVCEGPISLTGMHWTEMSCLDNWQSTICLKQTYCNSDSNAHRITVLAGNKTVDTYFRTPCWLLDVNAFERTITKIKKNEIDDMYFTDESLNYELLQNSPAQYKTYVKALQALGLEVPAIFQKIYDAANEKRRKEILESIHQNFNECKKPFDNLEKELKPKLAELIEFGIHKQEQKITIAPGLELDLPAYIKGLCQKYDVPISQ